MYHSNYKLLVTAGNMYKGENMKCKKCNANIRYGAQFCHNCGAPVVDYPIQNNSVQQNNADSKKQKITTGVIVGLLVLILAILATITVFLFKGGIVGSANKSNVRKAYSTYLKDTIVDDIGVAQTDSSGKYMTGVYSAKSVNLNKNKGDEFIVAYAKKNGKKSKVSIDCYEYDNKLKKDKEENVKLVGTVNPDDDGIDVFTDDYTSPESSALSIVNNDGKTYVVYENLKYNEVEYYYGCQFYSIENGVFSECASIFAEFNEAYEVVYSENLPETMNIDSSDVNLDDYNIEGVPEGADILFALGEFETELKFDDYYDSVESAVCDFFKQFKVDEEEFWIYKDEDKFIRVIAENESKERLFEYVRYYDYDADENQEVRCELTDYTDVNSLIENADSNEDESDEEETERIDDEEAEKLFKQLKLKEYQYPMYYGLGKFSVNELSNDMILSMGFEMKEQYLTGDQEYSNKYYCTTSQLNKQIKSIVGPDVEYTVEDFKLYDESNKYYDFIGYSSNILPHVTLNGDKLIVIQNDGGGGDVPFIEQKFDYAEQTGDTINLYFKSAFVDTDYSDSKQDFTYIYYTDYENDKSSNKRYEYGEFSGYLNEYAASNFKYYEDGLGAFRDKDVLSDIWDDMNTAVYTFEKSSDGEYYFSGFEFIKK